MHTAMERQFTLYEISTPYGRSYIGITSQPLAERLRQHLQRAKKISETAKRRNACLTPEQRKSRTEKARAARLAKYGGISE